MGISLSLIQILFSMMCILFSVTFATHYFEGGMQWINIAVGLLGGSILAGILFGIDLIFRRFNLRSFNTAILGLFFGYFMAQAILLSLSGATGWEVSSSNFMPLRFLVFLICTYLGLAMTVQAAEEIRVSIPFIEFKQMNHKKKDILIDLSILSDSRLIDLASTGLLDHHLIIPRFAIKELYTQAEIGNETTKAKARRSLEMIKKLESLPSLDLRYIDTDFPEIKDPMAKLIRLARFMDTHIITSDINRIQQLSIEGVRIINIHMLSNALKPITQTGEWISIKIQRYGKDVGQGVGYLEDGTMVVVNGGAKFFEQTIKACVISVKTTPSGRMVFCNASEEENLLMDHDFSQNSQELETSKSFLAL
jgi:uncharacterized protein YacL